MEKRAVTFLFIVLFHIVVFVSFVYANSFIDSLEDTSVHVVEPSRTYYQSSVPLEFYLSKDYEKVVLLDNSGNRINSKILCHACNKFKGVIDLKEGFHFVRIQVYNGSDLSFEKELRIIIDSKSPKIVKVGPRNGFADGNFEVEFSEEFVDKIVLNFGNEVLMKKYEIKNEENCNEAQRGRLCRIKVNLSEYDGESIIYFFEIKDSAGNLVKSKQANLDVDISKPKINSFDSFSEEKKITFNIEIKEKNFDEISYIDDGGDSRKKTLCRKLNLLKCIKTVNFREGGHDLTFTIVDKAGNYEIIDDFRFFCSSEGCILE